MRLLITALTTSALIAFASHTTASDDRPDHFKGLPSANLEQALHHLSSHNEQLASALSSELTPAAMADIHQLTYTLEVALARLASSIETLQEQLEEVHLGSETMDTERVQTNGQRYLEGSRALTLR